KMWPELEKGYLPLTEKVSFSPGQWVFQQGDPPQDFYIVGSGLVQQTLRRNGDAWLQRTLGPADIFGQGALYLKEQQTEVRAVRGTVLYRMRPTDLRAALEHNEKLYEYVLRDKLIVRLRPFPLLRSLSDGQLRWVAAFAEEVEVAQGADVPMAGKAGLWMIERGQIEVAGPVAQGRSNWRLTAGNFFLSGGPTAAYGVNCIAQTAKARVKSQLLYAPTEDFNALAQAFPDFAAMSQRPVNIPAILAGVGPLKGISEEQRQHLAQFCGWRFVPAGQNITTQGLPGYTLVMLRQGLALVTALDDRGRPRPRHQFQMGEWYGVTSLLQGKEHDASVRALALPQGAGLPPLNGTDVIALDRRDMQVAFRDRPDLWTRDNPLVKSFEQIKQEKQPFPWMQEGEVLRFRARPHWLWLVMPELGVLAAFLFLLLITLLMPDNLADGLRLFTIVVTGLILVPLALIIAYNYYDDYYAVTNRRVTRRDHQLIFYEARTESPIESVQDITWDAGFWGRVFDYGDVVIRSAARIGAVRFERVPSPDVVRERIMQEKIEAVAARVGQQRERLRRDVITGLRLTVPIPEESPALGEGAKQAAPLSSWDRLRFRLGLGVRRPVVAPVSGRPKPAWLVNLMKKFPERWGKVVLGKSREMIPLKENEFLWRKHWVVLLRQVGPPFGILLLWIAIGLLIANLRTNIMGLSGAALGLPWTLILCCLLFWVWWEYEDYRNDIYIVTDDQIIDIEAKPLWLSMRRREGGLDRVQNVDMAQVGLWQNLLNYGNVDIKTAATDEGYTFLKIANPRLVQSIVFQKLDAFRSRQAERLIRDRQREMIEGLNVYNELKDEGFKI
ncbi:MAG: cyclic nucleotide-binding domain-containing protein, partial [Anaerolineae bacterium]|nr:cyclic nucleotide-binding domain-containing protein [Anaerolineae bacterium]